jgi:hypothetical protein
MHIHRRTILVLALLTVASCVRTKATRINEAAAPLPSVPPEQVYIFTAASELDTLDYVRVAILEATAPGELTSQRKMLRAMREKAGKLGANGILMPEFDEPDALARVAATAVGTGTQRRGSVVAIYVKGRKQS